uniref:RING-type E3 ubiquitin transferase n=1 Tax=Kalanchoe fedtschenkoi TaxID=63787 RepID=A0A7N0RAS7_KALFE
MKTHRILVCNILLFICPIVTSTCPSYECSTSGPAVRFPFHLQQHPTNCSHPGFQLACTAQAFTSLSLPNSGSFYVRDIDYYHQQIVVYDPDDCTPNRLLNLNLSNSPFYINNYYYRNYTFLSCPTDLVRSRYTTIDCLSNSTTSVLATVSPSLLAKSVSNSCTIITSVPIPISYDQNGFASDLSKDFRLTWSISGCETRTGGFQNCQTGPSPNDLRVFRIVVLCFSIPAVSFTVGVAMYFWFLDQRRRRSEWALARDAIMISVHPSAIPTLNNGLDDSTIESYAKMVVGESKRIPGPNDIACPICLSDYCAKDTLRCIPECQHCFHADCVDEWLRCNSTCPVCRNSPSHA